MRFHILKEMPPYSPCRKRVFPFARILSARGHLAIGCMAPVFSFARFIVLVAVMGYPGTTCVAATVPTIKLPKKTFTVYTVTIAKPTGDPVAAGSADNEFTFGGAAGVATIPVEATVQPARLAAKVGDMIKWTFVSIPAGSALTWNNPWPGEATAGRGATAVATLTGYPASNNQFGPRTIKMEVIRNGKAIITKTANIELFFERDAGPAGHEPNWFYYWLQAIGGRANTVYGGGGGGVFGEAPGMLRWSYAAAQDKGRIIVYDAARLTDVGDARGARGIAVETTGIDAFEDTVVHENHHTVQIPNADAVVSMMAGTPWRFGWSWNQVGGHNHWTVGPDGKPGVAAVDDDGNGTIDDLIVGGPGELGHGDDANLGDTGDPALNWPLAFGALPPLPWAGGSAVEEPAYDAEPDTENRRAAVDWADPGKQHRTLDAFD